MLQPIRPFLDVSWSFAGRMRDECGAEEGVSPTSSSPTAKCVPLSRSRGVLLVQDRGIQLLDRVDLPLDLDARGAEGTLFETAVFVRPVDRCLGPPEDDRRGTATPGALRHERAHGLRPRRPARDPPGDNRQGDGSNRSRRSRQLATDIQAG